MGTLYPAFQNIVIGGISGIPEYSSWDKLKQLVPLEQRLREGTVAYIRVTWE